MNPPTAAAIAGTVRLLTGVMIRWVGCRPSLRQRVYFGNHTSHLDAVLIWSCLPPAVRLRTRPVAAHDYWGGTSPLRQLVARLSDAVLIERDNATMEDRKRQIDAIVDALGVDRSLILFPEGTRGPGPTLQPFRSGLYHLCRRKPGLEIVPVHLDNVHRVLPREELVPVPLACGITFGPPMTLADGEAKDAFLERARAAVRRLEPEEAPC